MAIKGDNWLEKNEYLFNNLLMSDCSFWIKLENVKIPAHKYILGGSSKVFYDYFYVMNANSDEIIVENISVNSFLVFLKFLYTGNINEDIKMNNILNILKLADRYSVKKLIKICNEFLKTKLNKDNAIKFLEKLADYKLDNFEDMCLNLISKNRLIFESSNFYEISNKTLQTILSSKELRGFNEITIYNGVNKWAELFCQKNQQTVDSVNKRLALGKALEFIRFGTMTSEEFTECTLNNPILDDSEIFDIYTYIGSEGKTKCKYSGEKRDNNINSLLFSNSTPTCNYYGINKYDLFNFSVSKPIKFLGIFIYGRVKSALKESIESESFKIQLLNENRDILFEYTGKVQHNGTDNRYYLFQYIKLVLLNANQKYIIHIEGDESASKFMNYETSEQNFEKEDNEVKFYIKDNNYVGAGIVYSVGM